MERNFFSSPRWCTSPPSPTPMDGGPMDPHAHAYTDVVTAHPKQPPAPPTRAVQTVAALLTRAEPKHSVSTMDATLAHLRYLSSGQRVCVGAASGTHAHPGTIAALLSVHTHALSLSNELIIAGPLLPPT